MNKILLDLPTQIITPRLILRPPQAGDGIGMYQAYKDGYEDLITWLNQPPLMASAEQFEIDCRQHQDEWILRSDMRLLVIERETNIIIGRNSYPPHLSSWHVPYFGISYMLGKTYRHRGYATESVNAMIHLAFTHLKARKVEIKCDIENTKSINVPRRLNMALEATQVGTWPSQDKKSLATINTYATFSLDNLPPLAVEYL